MSESKKYYVLSMRAALAAKAIHIRYGLRLFAIMFPFLLIFVHGLDQSFFNALQIFTHVPYNFWFWLIFITAPLLVFNAKPESSADWRIDRLILAIGATYILMNFSLHTSRQIIWSAYEACQSRFSDGAIQHHKECGEINIADGASNIFYLIFGWLPATGYVGLCEFIWRWRYRRIVRKKETYAGMVFSSVVVIIAAPVILYALFIFSVVIYEYIYPYSLHR